VLIYQTTRRHFSEDRNLNTRILIGKPGAKTPSGKPRRMLENYIKMSIKRKYGLKTWMNLPDSGLSLVAGPCEHGNESSVYVQLGEMLPSYIIFKGFTTMEIHVVVFYVMTACSLVGSCQRFGRIYCLHLQGIRY
jgi:hypothetical protein